MHSSYVILSSQDAPSQFNGISSTRLLVPTLFDLRSKTKYAIFKTLQTNARKVLFSGCEYFTFLCVASSANKKYCTFMTPTNNYILILIHFIRKCWGLMKHKNYLYDTHITYSVSLIFLSFDSLFIFILIYFYFFLYYYNT